MKFQEFLIPAELNGEQLKKELGCDEVYVRDGVLVIGGDITKTKIEAGIAAHKPVAPAELSIADKLAAVGLSLDDLKAALGV